MTDVLVVLAWVAIATLGALLVVTPICAWVKWYFEARGRRNRLGTELHRRGSGMWLVYGETYRQAIDQLTMPANAWRERALLEWTKRRDPRNWE
jgi:hypothetical protein